MKTRKIQLSVIFILICGISFSQEKDYIPFPAQLTFVYPIGTSGTRSGEYGYNFSLNVLTGITGSINGCEIGGLTNLNKGNLSGFQVGGIGNVTKGNVVGMQLGGIYSITNNLNGLQLNGIISRSGETKGVQISGIISFSNSADLAISGIANINNSSLQGVQIGGIYNRTRVSDGLQIGLINQVDTINRGISIGLINIIKKGFYSEWSVSAADYVNIAISYKFGVKHFYNIYSVGMNFIDDYLWAVGLGLGHLSNINAKVGFQPEIICYTYFPGDFQKPVRGTYVTHLKFGFVRNLNDNLALSVAPSIYWSIKSNREIQNNYGYDHSPINPVASYYPRSGNSRVDVGYGICLGLNIR